MGYLHDIFDETVVTADGIIADMISSPKSDLEDTKSVIPLLRNKEAFRKKGYKTKGSYFAECERNPDTGGCLPKGEHGHGKLADPTQQTTPGISDETLQKLSKIGSKAIAKSKDLRDLLKANWNKIPKSLRYPVAAAMKLFYSGYYLGNKAVYKMAVAKGLKEEDAKVAARLSTAFDVALGGTRAAAVSALLGFPELSPVAAMLPIGSLSYLAFTTAKNPIKSLKMAKKAIQSRITKKSEGIKHFVTIDNRFWEVKYSPDQPRGAKGTEEGGQFIEAQGSSIGSGKLEEKNTPKQESSWKSKATVKRLTAQDGFSLANKEVLNSLFGEQDNYEETIATAVGAPDNCVLKIKISNDPKFPYAIVDMMGGGVIDGVRNFMINSKGERVVSNEYIQLHKDEIGNGLGTDIFSKQVENCAKLGFSSIECEAAGKINSEMNGYYSWPRMGYDAELSFDSEDLSLKNAKKKFQWAKTVSDLMSDEDSRNWWKENGSTFNAKFDLKEGSRSRQILDAYLDERNNRMKQ